MKIAYFTDSYLPKIDGVATSVDSLSRELAENGHEVVIFAPKQGLRAKETTAMLEPNRKIVRFDSFSYYFQPEIKLSIPAPLRSLRETFKSFDIIHSHSPGPLGVLAEEIALLRGIPHIHTFHTLLSEYNHYLFQGKLLSPSAIRMLAAFWCNRVDYIVAPSKKVRDKLLADGVKQPIEVIPSGIDLGKFRSSGLFSKIQLGSARNLLINRGLVKMGEFVFLTVGRLGKEKDINLILEGFTDLVQKTTAARRSNLRLLIAGDGPERLKLVELANKLNLNAYVSFAGYILPLNMPQVYNGSNVFVFSSKTETQGLVVLEAAAASLPVVAVKDSAIKEVVTHGKNGFLVEDKFEFTEKCMELFENESLRKKMSQESVKAAEKYSIRKTAARMIEYYKNCQADYSARSRRQKLKKQYQHLKTKFKKLMDL